MTAQQAEALGYKVVAASAFEIGLTKNGKGIRTWWVKDVGFMPPLDHPLIQTAIDINERHAETNR